MKEIKSHKRGGYKENADLFKNWAIENLTKPDDEVFCENATIARHHVKRKIINRNLIPHECGICGIGPEWLGNPMPLILDHINGINNDNRLDNLRFVCSNCDSQLPTYKARNIKQDK
jgi:hypothetical protein